MTGVPPKKNAAFVFYCSLVSQADTRLLKSSPTLATGDVKVSLDGGALANLTTLPTVTPAAGVSVKVSLSAAEMNADDVLVVFADAAGAEWCDKSVSIKTAVRWMDDLAFPTVSGTGDVAQTGDNFARLGVNGVGLSAIPDLAGVTTLLSRLSAVRAGYLDNVNNATLAAAVFPIDPADQSLVIAATTVIENAIAALSTLLTSTGVALTAAERLAIADATLTRTLPAESYAVDGAVPTLAEMQFMLLSLVSQFSIIATALTTKKLDGVTTAMVYTLDNATNPTARVRSS